MSGVQNEPNRRNGARAIQPNRRDEVEELRWQERPSQAEEMKGDGQKKHKDVKVAVVTMTLTRSIRGEEPD